RRYLHAELLRIDLVGMHIAFAYFRHPRWTCDCDLVETIQPMHDECAMRAKHAQCLCHLFDQVERVNANHLCRSSGGVGEWPQQIEDRTQASFASDRRDIHGGRVDCWSK